MNFSKAFLAALLLPLVFSNSFFIISSNRSSDTSMLLSMLPSVNIFIAASKLFDRPNSKMDF